MDLFTKPTPDTVWPNPLKADAQDLSWRMRYSNMLHKTNIKEMHSELMLGASFMDAFASLIRMPGRRRNKVIAALRADSAARTGGE